jgi:hypothetical protein
VAKRPKVFSAYDTPPAAGDPADVDEDGFPISDVETATYRSVADEFARLNAQGLINADLMNKGHDKVSPEMEEAFLNGELELVSQRVVHDKVDLAEALRELQLRREEAAADNLEKSEKSEKEGLTETAESTTLTSEAVNDETGEEPTAGA